MVNYYKYLPASEADENWGLHLLNAGYQKAKPHRDYPESEHPAHHYFDWNRGRILYEYQIVFIYKGSGDFESAHCPLQAVTEGTVLLLFPGEWHRYRPHKQTGWDEFWVGCKGRMIQDLVRLSFFQTGQAVLQVGIRDDIIRLFIEIIELTKEEKTGYQPWASGIVMHLLGLIYSLHKQKLFEPESHSIALINKAKALLRTYSREPVAMKKIASELTVSYAWFRKTFKQYTGISPNQYLLQLKIEQAKSLLADPSRSIKQIAFDSGFESPFYFSKLFRNKTGITPEQYRQQVLHC